MKKKIFGGLLGLFLIGLIIIISFNFFQARQNNQTRAITTNSNPNIWVLSDTHFISNKLHDDGKRFRYMESTAASKDLKYGKVLLTSLVQKAIHDRPAAVVITGDVTFNGEKQSALDLMQIFKPLTENHIKFLVIPGNHDIYDGWARSFKGDNEFKINQISPNKWKSIFSDSYKNAMNQDPASLSYTVKLNNKYQLLLLDSNKYPVEESATAPSTNGEIRPETISWMKKQLAVAKKQGLRTISFMHHNIYEHSSHNTSGYVIKNTLAVQKLYKKYDVKLNFAGHIHAQDISADQSGFCPTIEVLNGSFSVTPNSYGKVSFSNNKVVYQKEKLDIKPFLTKKQKKNSDLAKYPVYSKKLFINETKAIMYEQIYYQTKNQPKVMDKAATAFADINLHFFNGTDHLTDSQVAKLEKSSGYKALVKYGGMSRKSIKETLQDTNLFDNKLTINYH